MPIEQILDILIAERNKLTRAIEALQGPTKRRGRPRKNQVATEQSDPSMPEWVKPAGAKEPVKKKREFSAAQREAAAERMRQRWAAKRKAESQAAQAPRKKTVKTE